MDNRQAYTVFAEPCPGQSAHKQCLDAAPAHHPPGLVCAHAEPATGPLPPNVPGSESVLALREAVHARSAPFFLDVCAGAGAPLSTALRQLGVSTLAIDPLLDSRMDLRDDAFFDHLLRICASKSVALAHAAPPCGEYTRAKLLPRGPRALRTPEALNGIPGLGPADALKVQESHLLFVTFSCGGQVSLEQPTNSMAWLEPLASHFLREIQADLVNVAACSVGLNLHKSWLFATCFRPLQALASVCEHPRGSHGDIRGTRDSSGGFLSRASAEYPDTLAQRYAQQVKTLFPVSASGSRVSLDSAPLLSRLKTLLEPPVSVQDGAGIFSVPDWSVPPPDAKDIFAGLRPRLLDFLLRDRLPGRLRYLCDLQSSDSLFQASEVKSLRGIFELWLQSLPEPRQVSWSVAEGQPYCLEALQLLSALASDRDTTLFPCLRSGVPTGFDADIPLSNVLVPQGSGHPFAQEIAICHGNWSSAEADPETLRALVEEELDKGWLLELDSLASAQARLGSKLAIGKMSMVSAPGKKPRLVVDSTVCGTNPSCFTPETFALPSVDDVRECFPLRMHDGKLAGFALDVKSAHKTVRVRPADQPLGCDSAIGRWLWHQIPVLPGLSLWRQFFRALVSAPWQFLP